jgi:hypothetical protein
VQDVSASTLAIEELVRSELASFKMLRDNDEDLDSDDLAFWKRNSLAFPHLYHVYIQVRGVRPSTARLEGMFSLASASVPAHRSSMSTTTLNSLLILKTTEVIPKLKFVLDIAARLLAEEKKA